MKKLHDSLIEYRFYKKKFLENKTKSNIRLTCQHRIVDGKEKCNYIVFLNYSDNHLINNLKVDIIL